MDRRLIAVVSFLLIAAPAAAVTDPAELADDIHITRNILNAQLTRLGPDQLQVADLFHELGRLYEEKGEISAALPHYESALTVYYAHLGVDHPLVRELIGHLAELYARDSRTIPGMGPLPVDSRDLAEEIRVARHIYERQKEALGDDHPQLLPLLQERARLDYAAGDTANARALTRELLERQRAGRTGPLPAAAFTLQMLGDLAYREGDLAGAINAYREALGIWETSRPEDHRTIAYCMRQLGLLYHEANEINEAIDMAKAALERERRLLSHILSFSSEQQRLAHITAYEPYTLSANVGDTMTLARSVLLHKGLVLESLIEDIRLAASGSDPEHQRLLHKRALTKQRLMQLEMSEDGIIDEDARQRRRLILLGLQEDIRRTEQQLGYSGAGTRGARRFLKVEPSDIQHALDESTALIEFIRYPMALGEGRFEDHYGAVIFTLDDGLHWVQLGPADRIDAHIRRYQQMVRHKDTRDTDLRYNLQRLYRLLWLPIDKSLKWRIERIIISPTHRINFVSFVTLLTPRGEFLNEHYAFAYVTSGRDLLEHHRLDMTKTLTIFAQPLFSDDGGESAVFEDLPGTYTEAQAVAQLAAANGYRVELFTREKASEENLKQVHSPAILHIATHGFFAGQPHWRHATTGSAVPLLKDERAAAQPLPAGQTAFNPMRDSGLAMAKADKTIRLWQQGLSEPVRNDGLLTAEEVSLLDLRETWLVVLPACDTGLGDAQTGEGVFGLRRGFLQAGARNLIMTLWSIPDAQVTPQMVREIYSGIFRGESPAQALAETQKKWMNTLRETQGLHAAVKKAGAFIVISQGPAYVKDTK
ncbi:MAG: CHAT domain-containing protein [Candidatus Omnitrophica bacterium]|nr:CHAT domain-containing protein [Candidatus Omnitrophota bacterium]